MGYFRFRRSIKLFPGIRWNLGSKGSSLSFGGRGAHYTIGRSGSRFTWGIPGTGLSYTEFHAAHRRVASRHPSIPEPSEQWVREHSVEMTLHTPDRKPGEPPIRPDQTAAIRKLMPGFDFSQIRDFGENQADNLIDQVRYQQKEVSKSMLKKFYHAHGHAIPDSFIDHCYDHPDRPWKPPYHWTFSRILIAGFMLYVFWQVMGDLFHKNFGDDGDGNTPRASSTVGNMSHALQKLPVTETPPAGSSSAVGPASSGSGFPDPKYWPREVRISAPVELSGTVDGGTIRQTAKPGAVLDATLSPDHKTLTLRRFDIMGTLPIGQTDFLDRARRAESGE